jgi:hypothetical protein
MGNSSVQNSINIYSQQNVLSAQNGNFQSGSPTGPPAMPARNLTKNLAKVKLNKIYENKLFQNQPQQI